MKVLEYAENDIFYCMIAGGENWLCLDIFHDAPEILPHETHSKTDTSSTVWNVPGLLSFLLSKGTNCKAAILDDSVIPDLKRNSSERERRTIVKRKQSSKRSANAHVRNWKQSNDLREAQISPKIHHPSYGPYISPTGTLLSEVTELSRSLHEGQLVAVCRN
jgi:hypothetical protein